MNPRRAHALLWLALVLAGVVLGTSSGLRLAANGLGCEPWPQCYAEAATALAVQQTGAAQAARLAHRISASAFALVALGAIVLGWRSWPWRARVAGVVLLAVVAMLAFVGRLTPSPMPAVTLINVLGGLALLGVTAFLLSTRAAGGKDAALSRWVVSAVLLLLALQVVTGTMVSVRLAGADCEQGCEAQRVPDAPRLWHPLQPGAAADIVRHAHGGEALHALHRLLGVAVVALLPALVMSARPRRAATRALLAALAVCVILGLALATLGASLGLAVAHALAAGALAAGVGTWLAGSLSLGMDSSHPEEVA